MLTIPVEIKKSLIHGHGIFAKTDISRGAVVWMFTPGLDQMFTSFTVEYAEPRMQKFIRDRGYLHPSKPRWTLPVDEAQFWNFPANGELSNCVMGEEQDGEPIILAGRDIQAGEELTICPESDADYSRKIESR